MVEEERMSGGRWIGVIGDKNTGIEVRSVGGDGDRWNQNSRSQCRDLDGLIQVGCFQSAIEGKIDGKVGGEASVAIRRLNPDINATASSGKLLELKGMSLRKSEGSFGDDLAGEGLPRMKGWSGLTIN